ncbi:hypothetical protein AB1L88_16245 [Tautonia sp. JC769]|uniref:hypothetical protein n=1 Tax=Tautonia sp. JC769 TaxID=3232135 RepID=UPI00345B3467
MSWRLPAMVGGVMVVLAMGAAEAQDMGFERPPIDYLTAEVDDPIARLQARLAEGETQLDHDPRRGYLPAVLEALGVSPTSQTLVFSKTSFQQSRISPRTPRAIYFSDDVYIGWIPGSDILEITAVDPEQGAVFYQLDQVRTRRPEFERRTHDCLSCHATPRTQGVPGHLVRSVYPSPDGQPVYNAGTFLTDHTSPIAERWGGWFVTGMLGDQEHMGNAFVRDRDRPEELDRRDASNVTDLSDRFNTSPYLLETSDVVALMVLEHQTQAQNFITALSYQARMAAHYDQTMNEALGRSSDHRSPSSVRRVESAAEDLVRSLLFVDEAPLSEPIAGTSGFAEHFAGLGPKDDQGRSLRDFDLQTRLFRYPLSYLIYSEAFDALPPIAKRSVYDRLDAILSGRGRDADFEHLTPDLRRDILAILRATKPDFPGGDPPG